MQKKLQLHLKKVQGFPNGSTGGGGGGNLGKMAKNYMKKTKSVFLVQQLGGDEPIFPTRGNPAPPLFPNKVPLKIEVLSSPPF